MRRRRVRCTPNSVARHFIMEAHSVVNIDATTDMTSVYRNLESSCICLFYWQSNSEPDPSNLAVFAVGAY
jgi:hypothetical protein